MSQEIVEIKTMGDALRNTGYKNIECAMSEIIDNSVQADAESIFVVVSEKYNELTGRNNIHEIAFLDNGTGMISAVLGGCLGIGVTTRSDRKGMGRFGVGLPQASLYACPRVSVYSWQNGSDNCQAVSLDINKVKKGEQTEIADPQSCQIPKKYEEYLQYQVLNGDTVVSYDFMEHGTLVIWENCDRVVPKTVRCLFEKLRFALGQKFRYFIHENHRSIKLIHHENRDLTIDVQPNDPLMLLEDNYVLGNPDNPGVISPGKNIHCTEPVFQPYGNDEHPDGIVPVMIKYIDPEDGTTVKEAPIEIRFSIVKSTFYDKTAIACDPGTTDLGKHVKNSKAFLLSAQTGKLISVDLIFMKMLTGLSIDGGVVKYVLSQSWMKRSALLAISNMLS